MALDDTPSQKDGDRSAAKQMADEPAAFCQLCVLRHHQVEDPSCPRHDSRVVNTARKSLQQHISAVNLVVLPNNDVKTAALLLLLDNACRAMCVTCVSSSHML